jgi:hypothetical protein
VGALKKFVGAPPAEPPVLSATLNGVAVSAPARVLAGCRARGVKQVLVQWQGERVTSATWEDFDDFKSRFPAFQLRDEMAFEAGRDVMYGKQYPRRRRARCLAGSGTRGHRARRACSSAWRWSATVGKWLSLGR